MLKEKIISTSGYCNRAFGEQEDDGNSVGSNSLGGALADYNMQVDIIYQEYQCSPSSLLTRISPTGHPLHASSLLREDEEAETCD